MEYNKRLYESLKAIDAKYADLNHQLETAHLPVSQLTEINKQLKHNQPIVEQFKIYQKLLDNANQAEKMISQENDLELVQVAKTELEEIKIQIANIEQKLKMLLLPVDLNNDKNVIVEMRPAAGGDEASIFVADLFDTYQRYADKQK
jgi:peptide chain release factor 1